jgi:hypothetical protein
MNDLFKQGLTDAFGFVGGALAGMFVGRAFGLDIFAAGYDNSSILGILLCGLGGGAGLQLARWARAKTKDDQDKK